MAAEQLTAPRLNQSKQTLWRAFRSHHPTDAAGLRKIALAWDLAVTAHRGQVRASGEPFVTHPIHVAIQAAELGLDADTVAASLCHDVVEDTEVTRAEIAHQLGESVARIVDGVTKLSKVASKSRAEQSAENLTKLLLAATADPRVLVVKICDRLHNASTLSALPTDRRERIATETLEVYAPIAHRLGLSEKAAALEDHAFQTLHPDLFAELSARIDQVAPQRSAAVAEVAAQLAAELETVAVEATVTGRSKHVYSTWRKTQVRGQQFDDIADLVGVRVIVNTPSECYTTLGAAHRLFVPLPGRFRDYIAHRKYGNYQSLHTTVTFNKTLVEVQVRTWQMHAHAEYGAVAHWRYKDAQPGTGPAGSDAAEQSETRPLVPDLPWLHPLLASGRAESVPPEEFLRRVREDLGADEIVVFTPAGDPITLPEGSSLLDAAYAVHTGLGRECAHGKVNGTQVPRGYLLSPGDVFEVITVAGVEPEQEWLRHVRTTRATADITHELGIRRRDDTRTRTLSEVLTALDAAGVDVAGAEAWWLQEVAPALGYATAESLLNACAEDENLVNALVSRVVEAACRTVTSLPNGWILGDREADREHRVVSAACCTPEPGQETVGVRNAGGPVVAHRPGCRRLIRSDQELCDVTFAPRAVSLSATLRAKALTRRGLLADIEAAAEQAGTNVTDLTLDVGDDGVVSLAISLRAPEPDAFWRARDRVGGVHGVFTVLREATTPRE